MYKTKHGYRHRQFDISRGSLVETHKGVRGDDSANGWYVDRSDSDALDRRGPGFETLREAVEEIDRAVAADLRCPHCDLWIGDQQWPGLPSVDHDLQACNDKQLDLARVDADDHRRRGIDNGLICSPGKFEGEPPYVPYLWEIVLGGDSNPVDDPDRPGGLIDLVTLTEDDKRRFPALTGFDRALLWVDDHGFVYCDLQQH